MTRVCWPAMATPTPASSSDRATGRAGEPVARRRPPAGHQGPGTLRVASVAEGKTEEWEGTTALTKLPELLRSDASVWVDLSGPSDDQVQQVGAVLALHPLIVEDILEGNQRAKIELTDGVVHIVLFSLEYANEEVIITEIDLVLGLGFVLTAHDRAWDPRASHHLRSGVGPILKQGPDHMLWAICDDVVDSYFPFADRLGDAIDEVQDEVVLTASPDALQRLFRLKRELIEVRRHVGPVREVFNQLTNRDTPLIDAEEVVYFRDVYDHIIRLTDELDNYRELAAATLDVYLTQVNNNLSTIMKRLTGVTVILAGIGAVGGIFGMSEAHNLGGFWAVTGVTVAAATGLAVFLRRINWI
jgi:magnesium transporter